MFTSPKVYVLAVPCPLSFMLFVILAMIMKYIYLSIYSTSPCQPRQTPSSSPRAAPLSPDQQPAAIINNSIITDITDLFLLTALAAWHAISVGSEAGRGCRRITEVQRQRPPPPTCH